jgi:predicted Zn-dependent protease
VKTDPAKTVRLLDPLRRNSQSNPFIYESLYDALINSGRTGDAKNLVKECCEYFPGNEVALALSVREAANDQRFGAAATLSNQLVNIVPENRHYRKMQARNLLANRQFSEALEAARLLVAYDNEAAENHIMLAEASLAANDLATTQLSLDNAVNFAMSKKDKRKFADLKRKISVIEAGWLKTSLRSLRKMAFGSN